MKSQLHQFRYNTGLQACALNLLYHPLRLPWPLTHPILSLTGKSPCCFLDQLFVVTFGQNPLLLPPQLFNAPFSSAALTRAPCVNLEGYQKHSHNSTAWKGLLARGNVEIRKGSYRGEATKSAESQEGSCWFSSKSEGSGEASRNSPIPQPLWNMAGLSPAHAISIPLFHGCRTEWLTGLADPQHWTTGATGGGGNVPQHSHTVLHSPANVK